MVCRLVSGLVRTDRDDELRLGVGMHVDGREMGDEREGNMIGAVDERDLEGWRRVLKMRGKESGGGRVRLVVALLGVVGSVL